MARFVQLDTRFEEPLAAETPFSAGGILLAHVSLRLRGERVLSGEPVALNLAARALVRSALEGHEPAPDDPTRALLPCPLDLGGRGGVVRDARVRLREFEDPRGRRRRAVLLDGFVGFDVAPDRAFEVPWGAWARQALRVADQAVRRCPAEPPPSVAVEWRDAHRAVREETRALARELRARLGRRRGERPAVPSER